MTENEIFSNQANNLLLQAEEKTAKMSGNPKTNRIGATLLCLALIAAGLVGNYFKFPIFLNLDFLFGSTFAMLALQFFGLARGIMAAAIIAGYTYILWNHPYAIVIMSAEVAVVGWLMGRRKMGMVLADTLYWLIIGMPLAYFFYNIVMHVPFSGTAIVMIKQAVNGIANALVARLIFTGFSLRLRSSLTSFSEIIYNLLTFFVLFPALVMLAIGSRADFAETDSKIRTTLIQDSQRANRFLETWVENRETAVVNLADMAAARSPEQMQSYLELTRKSDGNFMRIGLLDSEANIAAYFPLVDELGQKNIGKNFADRPFIPKLKQTLKPMLSEVVMGRIGTPKPMITMLAPLVIHGEYGGYITGILSMEQIREYLDKSSHENIMFYTLIDKNGNIIMTSRTDQKVMTQFERGSGSINPLGAGISQWVPVVPLNTTIMERWKNSSYIAESTIGRLAEWKLILEQPVSPFQKKLYDDYTSKLILLFLILLGALVLSELLSRRYIVTLDKLCLITHDLPGRLLIDGKDIAWPESGIMETNYLISNFIEMADSLSGQFRKVQQAQDALKLAYIEVEMRVRERTAELDAINSTLTTEIAKHKLAEEALKAALQEKEVLLREIHHRVKNNMQVISSLLNLQADRVENEQVRQSLVENQQRIIAMSMIHEALYSSQNLSIVDLSAYLKNFVSHLQGVFSDQAGIHITLELNKIELDIDQAVPCGLIINELITNAFRHAFPDGRKGTIQIKVHQVNEKEVVLVVSDNGVGLISGLDIENPSSLGLRLVQGLIEHQLKGRLDVVIEGGTAFTLRWPLPDKKGENT